MATPGRRPTRRASGAERLAPDLVGTPYLTARDIASRYELSRQGAYLTIKSLVDLEILEDTGAVDSHNARIYVAPEVVRIVSS